MIGRNLHRNHVKLTKTAKEWERSEIERERYKGTERGRGGAVEGVKAKNDVRLHWVSKGMREQKMDMGQKKVERKDRMRPTSLVLVTCMCVCVCMCMCMCV